MSLSPEQAMRIAYVDYWGRIAPFVAEMHPLPAGAEPERVLAILRMRDFALRGFRPGALCAAAAAYVAHERLFQGS